MLLFCGGETMIEYTHAKALVTIQDDDHIYFKKGNIYEILFYNDNGTVELYCEPESNDDSAPILCVNVSLDDTVFEFLVVEDDVDES
jgi:hypothetical protein